MACLLHIPMSAVGSAQRAVSCWHGRLWFLFLWGGRASPLLHPDPADISSICFPSWPGRRSSSLPPLSVEGMGTPALTSSLFCQWVNRGSQNTPIPITVLLADTPVSHLSPIKLLYCNYKLLLWVKNLSHYFAKCRKCEPFFASPNHNEFAGCWIKKIKIILPVRVAFVITCDT